MAATGGRSSSTARARSSRCSRVSFAQAAIRRPCARAEARTAPPRSCGSGRPTTSDCGRHRSRTSRSSASPRARASRMCSTPISWSPLPARGSPSHAVARAVARRLGSDATGLAARLPVVRVPLVDELIRAVVATERDHRGGGLDAGRRHAAPDAQPAAARAAHRARPRRGGRRGRGCPSSRASSAPASASAPSPISCSSSSRWWARRPRQRSRTAAPERSARRRAAASPAREPGDEESQNCSQAVTDT